MSSTLLPMAWPSSSFSRGPMATVGWLWAAVKSTTLFPDMPSIPSSLGVPQALLYKGSVITSTGSTKANGVPGSRVSVLPTFMMVNVTACSALPSTKARGITRPNLTKSSELCSRSAGPAVGINPSK